MRVLNVRNVQEALPRALHLLDAIGVHRASRNGDVLFGGSVSTVYSNPVERVIFHPERDANPFFHLYESLWMLVGRNDVAPLERYVKKSTDYSDDGETLHGAYGHRWRNAFLLGDSNDTDQLQIIADRLRKDPDDRRCVLQMWNADRDLGRQGRDFPCNTMATFQRGVKGELNLTVFCRSNDIVWGAYGANAVQFGALLEFMALWIGCPIGTYTQISINWHGYTSILGTVKDIRPDLAGYVYDPYAEGKTHHVPMVGDGDYERVEELIWALLEDADQQLPFSSGDGPDAIAEPWARMCYLVLKAHHLFKTNVGISRYNLPIDLLCTGDISADWIRASIQWLKRRREKWIAIQPENF